MNRSIFSALLLVLGVGSALVVACSSSNDGNSTSSECAGPPGRGTESAECKSCVEESCGSKFSAFCAGNCAKDGSSSACQQATRDISNCIVSSCLSACDDSAASGGGGGSSVDHQSDGGSGDTPSAGSGPAGTPTTPHCKELAACCETLPYKEVKDPCLQAAGYDNDAPCLNLLNTYHTAGQCMGDSGGNPDSKPAACFTPDNGSCIIAPVPASIRESYDQQCTDQGGTPGDDCPTKDLVGCCSLPGGSETCTYQGAQDGVDAAACAQIGGTWSTKP